MFLWWDRQKSNVPSYHFIRAVKRRHYHRAMTLILGIEESIKIAISLRRKRALDQLCFITRDGFTKVAELQDERVLGRLIKAAMAIVCHAVDKGDKEVTEMLANDFVMTFQAVADSSDIEKPITQIVISLLEREVDDSLLSGKRKHIERLLEAGIEMYIASTALNNPLLPRILSDQFVRSWKNAIDRGVDRGIEESVECRAKEYGDAITSGPPDKDYKLFQVFMAVILVAYNKGHITIVLKLAKSLMTAINSANNANKNLLEKEIRKAQEEFKAAVQGPSDEDTTQRFLKLTTTLILTAKEEGFSDLEKILCRSFIQSIAEARESGLLAITRFVISNSNEHALQNQDLIKVGQSLRKAARDLGQAELARILEHVFPVGEACDK
jgi:hypothetical protein